MSRLRIAVLAGGRSSEHAVSLASARSVIAGLEASGCEVVALLIDREGRWAVVDGPAALTPGRDAPALLQPAESAPGEGVALSPGAGAQALSASASIGDVDVVFPVLHGPYGEDGTIQGLLETLGVAYVGAGVLAAATTMDKDVCKRLVAGAGIAVVPSLTLFDRAADRDVGDVRSRVEAELGWPVFVKPANLGSSVGISKVHGPDELEAALELAFRHDRKVLVEAFIAGRELEVGVLGNDQPEASVVGEIVPHAEWYDYAAKYDEGGSEIAIPADLPAPLAGLVRETALTAFTVLGITGMARIDFFLSDDGELYLNEINTIPGFTQTSVYASLFAATGVPYPELLARLAELAIARKASDERYRH